MTSKRVLGVCFFSLVFCLICVFNTGSAGNVFSHVTQPASVLKTLDVASPSHLPGREDLPLYPTALETKPDILSPCCTEDGMEVVTAFTKNGKYVLIPVQVENGAPLHYSGRISDCYGKDRQLHVDSNYFPELAKTGLHSDAALDKKDTITGMPVSVITYIGRPGRFSGAGFMADDEDIISVLKGDNALVKQLDLTHPQMAKPLFHVWNMILKEIELGNLRRFSNIQYFFYNGKKNNMKAESFKGYQVSIFNDEIQGRFEIDIQREFTPEERTFLKDKYSHLSDRQMAVLEEKLSFIHFSEMVPYYIMRYGFYEGHTDYRADPIALAWLFGLKTLEEIEEAFEGKLDQALTQHFTQETIN